MFVLFTQCLRSSCNLTRCQENDTTETNCESTAGVGQLAHVGLNVIRRLKVSFILFVLHANVFFFYLNVFSTKPLFLHSVTVVYLFL
ncbi:hypothetical protein WA026_007080 [Henosepilachna vigintioctopunctata]|uniref:Uncharacterized protein n=1 Tax=Henosepilachna vigintioctopunctata TaxID=420089 RepID=A0AAW1VBM3_9CUCU